MLDGCGGLGSVSKAAQKVSDAADEGAGDGKRGFDVSSSMLFHQALCVRPCLLQSHICCNQLSSTVTGGHALNAMPLTTVVWTEIFETCQVLAACDGTGHTDGEKYFLDQMLTEYTTAHAEVISCIQGSLLALCAGQMGH